MAKPWNETIEAHRRDVREAILETAAKLISDSGLLSLTMSKLAEETGIGRATLYKYFPDVEAVLVAWHDRMISGHLDQLTAVLQGPGDAWDRLERVLRMYAQAQHRFRNANSTDVMVDLHRGEHVTRAEQELRDLVRGLLAQAVAAGRVRADVPPDELTAYCLNALGAASRLSSEAAIQRLLQVTLTGLLGPSEH